MNSQNKNTTPPQKKTNKQPTTHTEENTCNGAEVQLP